MILFLDTSSLFKLYHIEPGTQQLIDLLNTNSIEKIYLAEITKIEFDSVVWKKLRKRELDQPIVLSIIKNFEKDS